MSKAELQQLEKMFRELQGHPPVYLSLNAYDAWTFIGLIQLALRHPASAGKTADSVKTAMLKMQDSMQLSDEMKEWLNRGWNPEYDKPIQQLNEYVHVRTDDFLFQNIVLSIAIHTAALAANCSPEEMQRGIEINAKESLDSLSVERKIKGINDYYKESRSGE